MLSRKVLRFLWPYGSMEMDSGGTMAMALLHYGTMALWHYGTMALWLGRAELVSGGGKWSREAMAKC